MTWHYLQGPDVVACDGARPPGALIPSAPAAACRVAVNEPIAALSSLAAVAVLDRGTGAWAPPQRSLLDGAAPFADWPRAGIMRAGMIWALETRAPGAVERGSGMWPTPRRSMAKRGWGVTRTGRHRYRAETVERVRQEVEAHGWAPRPSLLEWLMGWPIGWTALEPLTAGLARWRESHGAVAA